MPALFSTIASHSACSLRRTYRRLHIGCQCKRTHPASYGCREPTMTRVKVVLWALVTILFTADPRSQSSQPFRFVSPPPGAYVSGRLLLSVVHDGPGGGSAINDVTFYADGRQVCVVPGSRMMRGDAGPPCEHAFAPSPTLRREAGGTPPSCPPTPTLFQWISFR